MAISTDEKNKIAHLLRRAGFGLRPGEWPQFEKLGLDGTLNFLLHPEKTTDTMQELLAQIGDDYVNFDEIESVRSWWLYRMMRTRRPLEEKMTFFWHGHFATGNFKVQNSRLMWRQNETFRKHALGSFRSLLHEMVRDPAMLIWLDGAQNQAGKPNENFAREVMELFAIGIGNGYTEKDIQEAARCFTGWRFGEESRAVYDPFLHDDGPKTVFGQTGNFHGDDVIDIIARHPAAGKFLAGKLFRFFAHANPQPADIDRLAKAYSSSGFSVRAMLESLFTSPAFYSPEATYSVIKSPVEFVVMAMRSLGAPLTSVRELQQSINGMGQELFNPPSVKGWDGGRNWINSRTLMARMGFTGELTSAMNRRGTLGQIAMGNLAAAMAEAPPPKPGTPKPLPSLNPNPKPGGAMMEDGGMMAPGTKTGTSATLTTQQLAALTPERTIKTLWDALLPSCAMREPTRKALTDFMADTKPQAIAAKLPGLVNLIMAAPEYQLI